MESGPSLLMAVGHFTSGSSGASSCLLLTWRRGLESAGASTKSPIRWQSCGPLTRFRLILGASIQCLSVTSPIAAKREMKNTLTIELSYGLRREHGLHFHGGEPHARVSRRMRSSAVLQPGVWLPRIRWRVAPRAQALSSRLVGRGQVPQAAAVRFGGCDAECGLQDGSCRRQSDAH